MDLCVSYCIHMYPDGADRNIWDTLGIHLYRGCIADVSGVYCAGRIPHTYCKCKTRERARSDSDGVRARHPAPLVCEAVSN